MNKKNKFIVNILIILVVLTLVLYFSLKDNYDEIIITILHMNPFFILLAITLLCLYRILISASHYFMIKINHEKVSFLRCIQINFIILFFHGVTPFAGGGGPMEIYYLHNEKIPVTKATNITIQNFITYQIALVLVGIIALIYNKIIGLFPSSHLIKQLVVLGFIINILVLVGTFIISFWKRFQKILLDQGINLLHKLKLIKEKTPLKTKALEYLESFHENALILNKNKFTLIKAIGLNILALLVQYSIPLVVALGMNIQLDLIKVIIATAYVMIIGSFIPIPGGTGGIEYGFIFFYNFLIKGSVVNAMMLVWRFVTYYLGMILGGVALSIYRKKEFPCE